MTRRWVIWLALTAMWFSALSPSMASVLFVDRPDILARVLALSAESQGALQADICHTGVAETGLHANSKHPSGEGKGHAAHGVFCSFCLTASSIVTVPALVAPSASLVECAPEMMPVGVVLLPRACPFTTQHSRAPPSFV